MTEPSKNCQNCKQAFVIAPEDVGFYDKINVPPPTFCPECRTQRRMACRNERTLYKRKCDLCKLDIISMYSSDKDLTVYCTKCYNSDKWDPRTYARDYDFSRSFFDQLKDLQRVVPRISLSQENAVNSEWVNYERNAKNCYLNVGGEESEDCAYCTYAVKGRQVYDSYWVFNSELLYESLKCGECYKTFFSFWCFKCVDTWFSYDCTGCTNIVGCIGLRHKDYHIMNKPVSKEEYEKFIATYLDGSYAKLIELRNMVHEFQKNFPRRDAFTVKSEESLGNFIESGKDAVNCWHVQGVENSKNIIVAANIKDSQDVTCSINDQSVYDVLSCAEANNIKWSYGVWRNVYNLEHCEGVMNSNDCFGCIGLQKSQYCILNKAYSEQEYESLRAKIVGQMKELPYADAHGRQFVYGDFAPPLLCPFGYNETYAYECYPIDEQRAKELGYAWKQEDPASRPKPTVKAADLPDRVQDFSDDKTAIVECLHAGTCQERCTHVFRMVSQELAFYRQHQLPLPRMCPNCRHFQRIQQMNPYKLWARPCDCHGVKSKDERFANQAAHTHGDKPCPNVVDTSYAPDRKEIVYCETCYQAEVV